MERLEWFLFSPPESFLSPCPRLKKKQGLSISQIVNVTGFLFSPLHSILVSYLSVTILQLLSPNFVILNEKCVFAALWYMYTP